MTYANFDIKKILPDYWAMILLLDNLDQETFSISELGVSSRVFSHWKKMNLIPFRNVGRRVNLNVVEYFWVQVINDLRASGYPIEAIEKLKNELFKVSSQTSLTFNEDRTLTPEAIEYCESKDIDLDDFNEAIKNEWTKQPAKMQAALENNVSLFNLCVIYVLWSGANLSLVINNYGEFELYQPDEAGLINGINQHYSLIIEQFNYEPVLVISFRKYLYKLVEDPSYHQKIEGLNVLKPVELEVLKALRQGTVSELKIMFDKKSDNKDLIFTYKGTATTEELNDIVAMLYNKKHVKLEMKTYDGKTILYEYQFRKRHND